MRNLKKNLLMVAIPFMSLAFVTSCNGNNDETVLTPKTLASECIKTLCALSISEHSNTIDVPSALVRVDVLIDNVDFDKCITVTATESDKPTYKNHQKVGFKSIDEKIEYTFELYFNDVTTKEKESEKEYEIKSAFEGLCKYTVGDQVLEREFKAKTETETKTEKQEVESKFKIFKTANEYIELKCEKETSTKKTEYKYEYEIVKGEDKTENSIEIKMKESKKTEVKLEEDIDSNDEDEYEFIRTVLENNVEYQDKDDEETIYHREFDTEGNFTYVKK